MGCVLQLRFSREEGFRCRKSGISPEQWSMYVPVALDLFLCVLTFIFVFAVKDLTGKQRSFVRNKLFFMRSSIRGEKAWMGRQMMKKKTE